jgi:hypothetical protein
VLVNRSFFPPAFGFCPFRARVIGGDFSQGVALCYELFAPLGRKKNSPQRNVANSVCQIVIKVSEVGRTSRIGKTRVSRGSISVTKLWRW